MLTLLVSLVLSSPAFSAGQAIPQVYTCDGRDVSPPLRWTVPPKGTSSFALALVDPEAPGAPFTHWLALIVVLVIAALVLVVVARSLRIIPQARSGIVERLGRFNKALDPGMHVLIPFLDRLRRPLVDLREQVVTFEPQPVITQDNV